MTQRRDVAMQDHEIDQHLDRMFAEISEQPLLPRLENLTMDGIKTRAARRRLFLTLGTGATLVVTAAATAVVVLAAHGPRQSAVAPAGPPTASPVVTPVATPAATPTATPRATPADPTAGWTRATNGPGRYTVALPPGYIDLVCPNPGGAVGLVVDTPQGSAACDAGAFPGLVQVSYSTNGTNPPAPTPSSCTTVTSTTLTIDGLPATRAVANQTGACAADPRDPAVTQLMTVTYTITAGTATWSVSDYSETGSSTAGNHTADLALFDLIVEHMAFSH